MNNTIALFLILTVVIAFPVVCNSEEIRPQTELKATNADRHESKLKHDPIEDDPKYKKIFETIDAEVNEILKDYPYRNRMGFGHVFWRTKKQLLKEKYGIDWKSEEEMNPNVIFD